MHAANHFLDKKKESFEVYTLSNCYKNIPCARRPSLPALPNSWTIDSKVGGHPILIIVSTSGWSMPMPNVVVQTFGSRANHSKFLQDCLKDRLSLIWLNSWLFHHRTTLYP